MKNWIRGLGLVQCDWIIQSRSKHFPLRRALFEKIIGAVIKERLVSGAVTAVITEQQLLI